MNYRKKTDPTQREVENQLREWQLRLTSARDTKLPKDLITQLLDESSKTLDPMKTLLAQNRKELEKWNKMRREGLPTDWGPEQRQNMEVRVTALLQSIEQQEKFILDTEKEIKALLKALHVLLERNIKNRPGFNAAVSPDQATWYWR